MQKYHIIRHMKRKILIPVVGCLLLFIIVFFSITSIDNQLSISGLIIDKGFNYTTIMSDNDTIYTIDSVIKYEIGDYININYYGKLDYLNNNDILIKSVYLDKDPFINDIMTYINNLSIDKRIGQLIFAVMPTNNKMESITKYHIGGYIYFANDIGHKTVETIQNEILNYQKNSEIPLFFAIDEEGGTVSRISHNNNITNERFLSPSELYNNGGFENIYNDAIRKRELLTNLGFNINFAPVVDVVTDPNAYMYKRSIGLDAKQTGEFASTILRTQTSNYIYTFKHFPGYGNNIDTHQNKAIDNRTLEDFYNIDFIPYQVAINNNAKAVMVSHNIIKNIDNKPASLSLKMHNILREGLNFKGVIITDSLSMNAISNYVINPYVEAVLSGNNLIITNNIPKTYSEIKEAVERGDISDALLNRLVYRVIELKINMGLLEL